MVFYTGNMGINAIMVAGFQSGHSVRRLIFAEDRLSAVTVSQCRVIMVYVRPDIEAGTIQDQADVPAPPLPLHEADETDEEPDVEDIEVDCQVRSGDFLEVLAGKYFETN